MDTAQKQLLRAVVRRVHPDLFVGLPVEREQNSEALKVLNSYLDELAASSHSQAAEVTFWVKTADGSACEKVDAQLPAFGSLGPLFYAFGLISQEDLRNGSGSLTDGVQDGRNMVAWLGETVAQALEAATQHTARQKAIRALSASIKERFQLADILLSGEFAVTSAEQVRQLEALKRLEQGLLVATQEEAGRFCNLVIRLHHPESCPFDPFGNMADLDGSASTGPSDMQSHVAEDGVLHVVAEPGGVAATLASLDLAQARILRSLACFWGFRVQELSPPLSRLLGVEAVFCDSRSRESAQQFVLWAGRILQHREAFSLQAGGSSTHAFSLLVHSDQSAAMIDTASSSSLIQVRSDSSVEQLLQFLSSENSDAASRAAQAELEAKQAEALLLEQVRDALGASQVVRLCSSWDSDKVVAAAHRLLRHAPSIRAGVDLSGACLAIDDCYELWESGFISIPHHFQIQDLQPQLQRLLAGTAPQSLPQPSLQQPPSHEHYGENGHSADLYDCTASADSLSQSQLEQSTSEMEERDACSTEMHLREHGAAGPCGSSNFQCEQRLAEREGVEETCAVFHQNMAWSALEAAVLSECWHADWTPVIHLDSSNDHDAHLSPACLQTTPEGMTQEECRQSMSRPSGVDKAFSQQGATLSDLTHSLHLHGPRFRTNWWHALQSDISLVKPSTRPAVKRQARRQSWQPALSSASAQLPRLASARQHCHGQQRHLTRITAASGAHVLGL